MKVLAVSAMGQEFFYNVTTAHAVSDRSAETIRDALNRVKYKLKENQTWFIHEVDKYDRAFDFAQFQKFTIRKGTIKDIRS